MDIDYLIKEKENRLHELCEIANCEVNGGINRGLAEEYEFISIVLHSDGFHFRCDSHRGLFDAKSEYSELLTICIRALLTHYNKTRLSLIRNY